MNSVRFPVTVRVGSLHLHEDDPVGKFAAEGIAREQCAAVRIGFRDDMHQVLCRHSPSTSSQ